MSVTALMRATRPWSLPVTVAPVLLGSAVAYRSSPSGSVTVSGVLLALLGGLSVHLFGNLWNTLQDFECGVDRKDNAAADRALVDGSVTPRQVRMLSYGCLATAALSVAALAGKFADAAPTSSSDPLGLSPLTSFLLLVSLGGALAYAYTGAPFRLKYHRLGDVCILLAFGPLLAVGANFVHTAHLSLESAVLSLPLGLLTEAILHANNARDIRIDLAAHAFTLANSIGFEASYRLFQALYILAFASLPAFAWAYGSAAFLLPAAMAAQVGPLCTAFRQHDPESAHSTPSHAHKGQTGGSAPAKSAAQTDAAGPAAAASQPVTDPVDICDRCGQFSFGFGVLLTIAVLVR